MKFIEYLKNLPNSDGYYTVNFENEYFRFEDEVPSNFEEEKAKYNTLSDAYTNLMYEKTLCFVLFLAVRNALPDKTLVIEHSMSRGLYCELIDSERNLFIPDEETFRSIETEFKNIVSKKYEIEEEEVSIDLACELFRQEGLTEKIRLFSSVDEEKVLIYRCLGHVNSFYGKLFKNTGYITKYSINRYKDGFVIMYPSKFDPDSPLKFKAEDKLYKIFDETGNWNRIIGVENLADINLSIQNGNCKRLISISEGLHEKKYSDVADKISAKGRVKVVLIAGPSSSGKTTSSKRLAIQLMVNGFRPIPLEMDNYFVDRDKTPRLPDGSYDFESLHAVDLELFNRDVKDLIEGKEVVLPKFNFKTGIREEGKDKIMLPEDGILIIEGIHALNPEILSNIPHDRKFKIYASALTQLNYDNQNRISTTDVRRIRRMVRDYRTRGYSFEQTLRMFAKVSAGEKKNIFPYQREADVMFNTTLIYELSVLKKYAVPELMRIGKESDVYYDAQRLLTLLSFVKDIDDQLVMNNSVIREFIGGSFFD